VKRILIVAFGAMFLALGAFEIASAHAELDHCTPAVTSTVTSAPAQIVCVYSEEIDTKRSTMSVWDASGAQVDKKDAHVDLNDPNHETLVVSLDTSKTLNGLYTVQWRTVTPDDNGLSYGSWQFVIGIANTAPYQPTQILDGEVNAEGTVVATAAPSPTDTPATTEATAAPTATVVAAAAAPTATPEASPSPAAPGTAPTTGGVVNDTWALIALLGAVLLLGGAFLRTTR
jgi:methionine-rich copper-binding protein CopC